MRTVPRYEWPISHEPAIGACARAESRVKRVVTGKEKMTKSSRSPSGRGNGGRTHYTGKNPRREYTAEDACRLLALALQRLDI